MTVGSSTPGQLVRSLVTRLSQAKTDSGAPLSDEQLAEIARSTVGDVDEATARQVADEFLLPSMVDPARLRERCGVEPESLARLSQAMAGPGGDIGVESSPPIAPVDSLKDPAVRRVIDATRQLVRIPSQGGIDDRRPIVRALSRQLSAAGLTPSVLSDEQGRPCGVVAVIEGAKPGPTYALNAVVDSAPTGDVTRWSSTPFSGEIRGGRMYGRGVADSKIAAAMFIELGRELASRTDEMSGRTVLFFDAAEHTGKFEGVRSFLRRFEDLDGVIIGYPGNEALNVGSRGFARSELTVRLSDAGDPKAVANALRSAASASLPAEGTDAFALAPKLTVTAARTAAHEPVLPDQDCVVLDVRLTGAAHHSGSSQTKGVNAVLKGARLLEMLSARSGAAPVVLGFDGGEGYSIVPDRVDLRIAVPGSEDRSKIVERIREALATLDETFPAGDASQIVGARNDRGPLEGVKALSINVDVRTTPTFETSDAQAGIASAMEGGRRASPSWTVAIEDKESWPAFVLSPTDPLRVAMEDAVSSGSSGGKSIPSKISGPSNVGNLLASHGIPATTGYGVTFSGMHATNESIQLDSIPEVLAAHRRALGELMSIPDDSEVVPVVAPAGEAKLSEVQAAVGRSLAADLTNEPPGERRSVLLGAYAIWRARNGLPGETDGATVAKGVERSAVETNAEKEALSGLVREVRQRRARGQEAFVIVDIDDTLLDSRARTTYTARVIAEQFEMDCLRKVVDGDLPKRQVFQQIAEEWKAKGRDPAAEVDLHRAFVSLNDGLAYAPEAAVKIAGSERFVTALEESGAQLLYLTARVEPTPGATLEQLEQAGYPTDGHRIETRPDAGIPPEVFKRSVIESDPLPESFAGVLDDDARNHAVFREILPKAHLIVVDVQGAPVKDERTAVVRDFSSYPA